MKYYNVLDIMIAVRMGRVGTPTHAALGCGNSFGERGKVLREHGTGIMG
jgi:hypothetical protein